MLAPGRALAFAFLIATASLLVAVPDAYAGAHGGREVPLAASDAARDFVGSADSGAGTSARGLGANLASVQVYGTDYALSQTSSLWEDAQKAADPAREYRSQLGSILLQAEARLAGARAAFLESVDGGVDRSTFQDHLAAANLLVLADADLTQFRLQSWDALQEDPDQVYAVAKRISLSSPLFTGQVLSEAAAGAAAVLPAATGPMLDLQQMADHLPASALAGGENVILALARQTNDRAQAMIANELPREIAQRNITASTILDAIQLEIDNFAAPGSLARAGWATTWADEVERGASWWVVHNRDVEPIKTVAGSLYTWALLKATAEESEMLLEVYGGEERGIPGPGIAALLVGLLGLTRSPRGRIVAGLLVGLAILTLLVPGGSAQPYLVSDPVAPALFGHSTSDDTGLVHFVYMDTAAASNNFIQYRTYDPILDRWSDASAVAFPGAEAIRGEPHIFSKGNRLDLFWTSQESGGQDPEAYYPHTCRLVDGACGMVEAVGRPDHAVRDRAEVVYGADDGVLHTAWLEEADRELNEHIVQYRYRGADGWMAPITFDTGSRNQSHPALAVDARGTAHMVWHEMDPAVHCTPYLVGCPTRIMYAQIPAGAAGPARLEELEHDPGERPAPAVALAIEDGTIHLAYGVKFGPFDLDPGRLYHRMKPVDSGSWSEPVSVPHYERSAASYISFDVNDDGVIMMWHETSEESPGFQVARRTGGLWQRAENILDNRLGARFTVADRTPDGVLHWTFTGTAPGDGQPRIYYFPHLDIPPYHLPEIADVTPPNEVWVNDNPPRVTLRPIVSRAIDLEESRIFVDGIPVNIHLEGNLLVSEGLTTLQDGKHAVRVVLTDVEGGEAEESWSMWLDRQPPSFAWSIELDNGTPARGWHASPVFIRPSVQQDGSAFAWLEIQTNGGPWEYWGDSARTEFQIPEGRLWTMRMRAIDQAGNVNLGDPVSAGWDDDAPVIDPPTAQWGRPGAVLQFTSPTLGNGSSVEALVELVLADGRTVSIPSVRFAERDGFRITLPEAPSGDHQVTVALQDLAGNSANFGPWALPYDVDAPRLSATRGGTGVLVAAEDGESGLVSIKATMRGREWIEVGQGAARLALDLPELDDEVLVTAVDVAGNAITRLLTVDGDLIEAPQDSPDGGATDGHAGAPGGDPAGDGNGIPVPGVFAAALLLVGAAYVGRARR